jgi:hypothetical protein
VVDDGAAPTRSEARRVSSSAVRTHDGSSPGNHTHVSSGMPYLLLQSLLADPPVGALRSAVEAPGKSCTRPTYFDNLPFRTRLRCQTFYNKVHSVDSYLEGKLGKGTKFKKG